ncbi:Na+/H+ antiporter subunit E [Pseudonocardia sp.]|uniref:Na+/H+ antiporter subunit E n=1 Tax=Pseudonocardia sp. TaxID=60912 RepID=UPI00260F00E9|nr:Na+/H+ antiporter subunit E [Pseudonocardia sp.]
MTRAWTVAWLALVWVLLWGSFTLLTLVGGVLVGLLVSGLFRPGVLVDRLPVRPLQVLRLIGFVARDIVASSVQVSVQALWYGPQVRGAVLELPLLSRSDRVVALLANTYTLSPGTMVLQIDHVDSFWYVYVLGPREVTAVERARTAAMQMQLRVLAAVGSPDEVAQARRQLGGRP